MADKKPGNEKSWMVSLVFCFFLCFVQMTIMAAQDNTVTRAKELEAEKLLKNLNEPAVKSIKSLDGDIIDCIRILSQPAFDHTKLKNNKIQMRPTFYPRRSTLSKSKSAQLLWYQSGNCPKGTIPIRRTTKDGVLKADSIQHFGEKKIKPIISDLSAPLYQPPKDHEMTMSARDKTKELEAEKLLKKLNKLPVKSIKSPDGDIIDCIHILRQPAFDHPKLKNHIIQMRPTFYPQRSNLSESKTAQLWHQSGNCPKGTIPIRRTTKDDILRADSIQQFGKKKIIPIISDFFGPLSDDAVHEYAVAEVSEDRYYGVQAYINIWKPNVGKSSEFSISQIWIANLDDPDNFETIEAGWQIYPQMYGDYNPRLFIFWTNDSYRHTGCYNLACSGFVQVDSSIVLGGTLEPVSVYDGAQDGLSVLIWKDPGSGNWWMQVGDTQVGYWPSSLYNHMSESASFVEWGGEIINEKTNGQHTTTGMGSGHFPQEGARKASIFKDISVVDANNTLVSPNNYTTLVTNTKCYDISPYASSKDWGVYFFYGGPGRNQDCP